MTRLAISPTRATRSRSPFSERRRSSAAAVCAVALALAAGGCGLFGPEEARTLEMTEQDIVFSDDPPTVGTCESAPCGDEILALCRGVSADVCELRPDGSGLRVLTTDANAPLPSPSSDGEFIALHRSGPDGLAEYELIDRSGLSVLARTHGQIEVWRTAQQLIVSDDATGSYALVDRAGATLGVIPPIAEVDNPAFSIDSVSPDGAFLVAAVGGSTGEGYELWSHAFESGVWTKLDVGDDMLTLQGWSAVDAWSPDATSLYVMTTNRDSVGDPPFESQLVRVGVDGSDHQVVASFGHDGFVGVVAAPVASDRPWLAAVRSETAVSLFDLRSGALLDQVRSAFTAGFPGMAWTADGQFLVVDGGWRDDGTQQLAVVTVRRDSLSEPWLLDPGAFDEIHNPIALPTTT